MGKFSTGNDGIILSYNDAVLRASDLDILGGPYFLNDRIIEFYFSYISSCHPCQEVLLVSPSIAFWIMNCTDINTLKDFLQPLDFPSKKLVIFPVNDNDDVTLAEGGSHWSLLAFERNANVFVHHDSSQGMNKRHAKRLYNAVCGYTGMAKCSYIECPGTGTGTGTPQQLNGYDCGLFVAATARAICQWFERGGDKNNEELWFNAVNLQVNASVASELRSEILVLVKSLMANK